jgi:hypothetical protein
MLRVKRVHSETLRDEVYELRYRAYRREEAIAACPSQRFVDKYDGQPNHILWALTEHERVIGSIRTTWYDPTERWTIPEMEGYGEDVSRIVPQHAKILSGNRFVTEPDRSERSSLSALLLLRYHMVVAKQRAQYALAAVRMNHLPFYKRVLRLERASEGRVYPGLSSIMYLTACRFEENILDVYERTPLLRPHGYERMLLDDRYQDVWEVGLPIEDQLSA